MSRRPSLAAPYHPGYLLAHSSSSRHPIYRSSASLRITSRNCSARRMAEVAARLTDHVLPHLPLRQWVLSVPKRLRPYLHHDPGLAGAVLRIFVRAVRSELGRRSPGAPTRVHIAAVSFPQRFGSSLNPHFHYHVLAIDGVFSEGASGDVRFHEATGLSPDNAQRLARTMQRRVLRAFRRRGLLDDATADDMLTWQATGGFSVDASVRIEGDDRAGVERLVRYCARPPFALERLHALGDSAALASEDARLLYRLPEPDRHGRSALVLSPFELLDRISRLVPPPRVHRHRYHGVLAPNAKLRAAVVAIGRGAPDTDTRGPADAAPPDAGPSGSAGSERARTEAPPGRSRPSRLAWALLLARIYEVLPLICPACGGPMRIVAFLSEPSVVRPILIHLGLPDRPPPVAPARGPPQAEFDFDQTPGYDPADADPGPEFEFDQSLPEDVDP